MLVSPNSTFKNCNSYSSKGDELSFSELNKLFLGSAFERMYLALLSIFLKVTFGKYLSSIFSSSLISAPLTDTFISELFSTNRPLQYR